MILHAGLIALWADGWRGALIQGPSGAGKSDLALRCLAAGFRLVADDRVAVWTSGGALYGRAPDSLAGLVEARALGILSVPALRLCRIDLVVHLGEPVERLPEPACETLLGLSLPRLKLVGFEASAPSKLSCAIVRLGAGRQQEY